MAEAARRYEREEEIGPALRALSPALTEEVFATCLLFGEAERRTCTKNDPGILKGMIGWGRPIRSMREQLIPEGWKREEWGGLPLVVSPDGKLAITVAAGDDQTGNPKSLFALTKYEKGPMLRDWVSGHRYQQLSLDESTGEPPEVPDLWMLLVLRSHGEIIAELSQPTSVTKDRRLRFGGNRIFLKRLSIDQTLPYDDDDDDDSDAAAEVPVERL